MKIVASAPSRISLFGGSSDLPIFADKYDGLVISLAINLRQHMELSDEVSLTTHWEVPPEASVDFYKKTFLSLGVPLPNELITSFDGHIQGGLGTSASAAVLMAEMARRIKREKMNRTQLAERAWDIEVNNLKMYGGKQDQYAAAFGGMNNLYFGKGKCLVDPWERERAEALVDQILLVHLGESRKDIKIQEEFLRLTEDQIGYITDLREIARMAIGPIWTMKWHQVAVLLAKSWERKKLSNPKVTSPRIDEIYAKAIEMGAIGGKLCGSGGGGYMIFMGPPEKHAQIVDKLISLGCVPVDFGISWDGVESRIVEI